MMRKLIFFIFALNSVAGQTTDLWRADCSLPGKMCALNSDKSEKVVHVHHAHWYTCGLKISLPSVSDISTDVLQGLADGLVVKEYDQFGVYPLTSTIGETIIFDFGKRDALYLGIFSLATKSGESLNQLIDRTLGSAMSENPSVVISEIDCGNISWHL